MWYYSYFKKVTWCVFWFVISFKNYKPIKTNQIVFRKTSYKYNSTMYVPLDVFKDYLKRNDLCTETYTDNTKTDHFCVT